MSSMPKLSTVISWLIYLVPVYLFVLNPLLQQFLPSSFTPWDTSDAFGSWDDTAPGINVTDDSFISPEDGVPFNCAGEPEGLNKYTPSIVYDGKTERVDPTKRLSDRALLDRDDTVRCLEERARAFQGWRPNLYIERMWAQRYNASGHYRHHYDWTGSLARGGDRLSTFMVYLGADCEGGGTNFPRLQMPVGKQWCRFLECEDEATDEGGKDGITFKPIKGNAVFWENLRADGTGYTETWHAAYPVTSGTKVGLNIWSWYQPPRRKLG
ncbi:hypothetical protein N7533_007329 [Penicillium manginii]|uniref:uncharacterized protein n=1 Tax=Penicillium manginii TaxID=203109 RepID=UPI0025494F16|nr:uncharacterized protein N7533_007329 [Penicillium manginii]KAJ5750301.1 hypothetical protein N7533_007329 [Penicillium manginii]